MADVRGKSVLATGFQAPQRGAVHGFVNLLLDVSADGIITRVMQEGEPGQTEAIAAARRDGRLVDLTRRGFLLPGLVDLHVHAPQYPQLGKALDVPLEVWLRRYTFPLEARYAELSFARRHYARLVDDLIAQGTTTAVYFATVDVDATRILADLCIEKGQRALVGKVAMDHPDLCPPDYRDASVAAALAGTAAIVEHVRGHPDNGERRVLPVVTPRFIPACTDPLLEELGALARDCRCHVQTHVSESDWEHAHVLQRHAMSDAASLDRFGLVSRHSILAHGVFLSRADLDLLARKGAAIAHCPLSNAYFAGAVFPLRRALEKGVRVGLGTDIAGGPASSVFDSARMAVAMSRLFESGVDPERPPDDRTGSAGARIDFREAFYLATAGGADALDLKAGRFEVGYAFDALIVDPQAPHGTLRLDDELDRGDEVLQKIINTASEANIARVWVDGRSVKQETR